jgi:hypothetical protein
MPLHTIGKLLTATEELKSLQARTRRLVELQTLYFRSVPQELAVSSRVKNYKTGTLFVSADNAAVAAKLKHLAPRTLLALRQIDAEVTAIRIEVQVTGSQLAYKSIKTGLPTDALEKFDSLAQRVSSPGLKSALAALVKRHGHMPR